MGDLFLSESEKPGEIYISIGWIPCKYFVVGAYQTNTSQADGTVKHEMRGNTPYIVLCTLIGSYSVIPGGSYGPRGEID